jgi:hypothetical protein
VQCGKQCEHVVVTCDSYKRKEPWRISAFVLTKYCFKTRSRHLLYQIGPRIVVSFFCFALCLFAIMSTFASAFAALTEAVSGCDPIPSEESHQDNNSDGQRLAAVETSLVLLTEQVTALAQSVVCTDAFPIDTCRSVSRASVSAALHELTPVSLHSLPEDKTYRP